MVQGLTGQDLLNTGWNAGVGYINLCIGFGAALVVNKVGHGLLGVNPNRDVGASKMIRWASIFAGVYAGLSCNLTIHSLSGEKALVISFLSMIFFPTAPIFAVGAIGGGLGGRNFTIIMSGIGSFFGAAL